MTDKPRIKSSKRVAKHFNEACGRMISAGLGIILCLYLVKWLHMRRPEIEVAFYAKILVALLSLAPILWAAKYISDNFPYIYRYFVFRSRELNWWYVYIIAIPGTILMLGALALIVIPNYSNLIDDFIDNGQLRPVIAMLCGEMLAVMFVAFICCRSTAKRRGISIN